MIGINIKSIQQVLKTVNNKTGEINYLIMDEVDNEWKKLTEEEYNQIRGYENGE